MAACYGRFIEPKASFFPWHETTPPNTQGVKNRGVLKYLYSLIGENKRHSSHGEKNPWGYLIGYISRHIGIILNKSTTHKEYFSSDPTIVYYILYTHKNFVGCDKLPGIICVYTSLQLVNFFAQYARTKLFRSITTYIISLTSTTYIFDQDKIFWIIITKLKFKGERRSSSCYSKALFFSVCPINHTKPHLHNVAKSLKLFNVIR